MEGQICFKNAKKQGKQYVTAIISRLDKGDTNLDKTAIEIGKLQSYNEDTTKKCFSQTEKSSIINQEQTLQQKFHISM